MKQRSLGLIFLFIFTALSFAQTAPQSPSTSPSAFELLQKVSKHYAGATSYYIEEVQEITTTSDLMHQWQKTLLTAAEDSGRYHFESHSDLGSAERISDGTTEWLYHIEEKAYTKKSASAKTPQHVLPLSESALNQAENLRRNISDMANHYQSAEFLPDADLAINGKQTFCYRIYLRAADRKRIDPNAAFDMVVWIDKAHETVLKTEERSHSFMTIGNARIPREMETISLYPKVELDAEITEELFTFTPPADAQLLEDFPSPLASSGANLLGRSLPSLKLKSADGTVVSLDSFRGKPLLIDLWATWCGPCMQAMPEVNKLYEETKDKGLVILSIDRDEEAKLARDYLISRGYRWQNFHDSGDVESVLGESGIPRTLLVDAQGNVVFDHTAFAEDELRKEIAKLGPEYASIAPKPPIVPCTVAKQ